MKSYILSSLALVLILTNLCGVSYAEFASQNNAANSGLPMIFDPVSKKYFIGGNSKLLLKTGEQSGPVERIQVSIDGNDYQDYNGDLEFKNEGKHTIKFRASNPVNGWSPVQFSEVFVDLTPPASQLKISEFKFHKNDAGEFYVASDAKLSVVAHDELSGVGAIEYSWDAENFHPYTGPMSSNKPMKRTLNFRAIDRVGNYEKTNQMVIIGDVLAPESTLHNTGVIKPCTIGGQPYVCAADSVAFSLDATDDGAGVKQIWVQIDNEEPAPYIKPIYFLQEGPHKFTYYSEDNVANREAPRTLSLYTISNPPKTILTTVGKVINTGGNNYATREFKVKLEGKDNAVGLERVEIKLNDEKEFRPYMSPVTFRTFGQHTLTYRALDRVGNAEPTRLYTVNITETPPETNFETAQPLYTKAGNVYSPSPNVVTLNVKSSAVGVTQTLISINDGPFQNYSGPVTISADRKVNKIAYKSIDKLGNEEPPKTVAIHMIGTTPLVDLFVSDGRSTEEQIRTNYFGGQGPESNKIKTLELDNGARNPASNANGGDGRK